MSRLQLIITTVAVIGLGSGSLARSQDTTAESGTLRERLMKQFDENGDGKLSPSEQAKVREAFQKSRAGAALRQRPGQPAFDREAIMKRFDKDGDGQLNADERAAAQAAMAMFRGGPRFPGASDQPAEPRKSRVDLQDLLSKFDADGDGKLNEAERAKAKEAFQQRTQNATP